MLNWVYLWFIWNPPVSNCTAVKKQQTNKKTLTAKTADQISLAVMRKKEGEKLGNVIKRSAKLRTIRGALWNPLLQSGNTHTSEIRQFFQTEHPGKKGNWERRVQEASCATEGATGLTGWNRRTSADIMNITSSVQIWPLWESGQEETTSEKG